jgi:hypothetical protein
MHLIGRLSNVVNAFVTGNPPQMTVGDERRLERDLAVTGTGIVAAGLAVAVSATPALHITLSEIRQALSE